MVNWSDPVTIQNQALATVKLTHAVTGVYIWEIVSSFNYDWNLIIKPIPGRSILTKTCYILCRYLCLTALIAVLIGFNVTTEINCQSWLLSVYILGFLAFELASVLIAIRVVAIWRRARPVLVFVVVALLTQFSFIIYLSSQTHAHWDPAAGGCAYDDTQTARMFYTTTLCVDTAMLILMLLGLLQLNDAKKHGLWKFLWMQGFMWVFLVMLVEIPSVSFMWMNLNQPMNVIFTIPELVALVIAATRMYRSLTNFSDSYVPSANKPSVPHSRDFEMNPRVPVQVPIEVSVHRAYDNDRTQEAKLPYGPGGMTATGSSDDKYDVNAQ
ncbi:hypothetical protein PENSPDRAFT_748532 [Peniophora sp. CONT]|nr:hypothetical protein PENSPDRAFT_748532 [Peniophora sp. CONT]